MISIDEQIEEAARKHCFERAHGLMTQAWIEGAKWALEYVKNMEVYRIEGGAFESSDRKPKFNTLTEMLKRGENNNSEGESYFD